MRLDSGSITVFGQPVDYERKNKTLQSIGYMPQEDALISDLNVIEILQFFARLYRMNEIFLATRLLEMTEFLAPISMQSPISQLSGGEQRKVSFAIAIMHKPSLLILDEPSVCLDPLIRSDMWAALVKLSKDDGATVLMTTHYYQEAQNADRCAFMKNGAFLFEDSPKNICVKTNTDLIDEAVLRILQHPEDYTSDAVVEEQDCDDKTTAVDESSEIFSWILFLGVLQMEFSVFKRRLPFLIYLLMLQIAFSFMYTSVVGGLPKMINLGIVESDFDCINFEYDAKCEFEGEILGFY